MSRTIKDAFDEAEAVDLGEMDTAPDLGDDQDSDQAPDMPEDETLPPLVDMEDAPPEAEGAQFPLNDYGNGQRLALYYGADFLFVPRLGWFRWDGRRWAADEDEIRVRQDAQKIAAHILHEIPFIALDEWQREALETWFACRDEYAVLEKVELDERTPEQRERWHHLTRIKDAGSGVLDYLKQAKKDHRAHAKSSGNSARISNMLQEAKTAKAVDVGDLNRDKLMLCCENGVLQFSYVKDEHSATWGGPDKTAQVDFLPHHRHQKITKMAAAEYHPDARCPLWEKFLERVLPDSEVRAFVQRWFGYWLTGETAEQKLEFFFGGGRNG